MRYGYQNQEEDPEFWGGAVSYEYRIEDPRIGRFFSVDPLAFDYPWNSPYAFSENRVISAVELEGLEAKDVNSGNDQNSTGNATPKYEGSSGGSGIETNPVQYQEIPIKPGMSSNGGGPVEVTRYESGAYANLDNSARAAEPNFNFSYKPNYVPTPEMQATYNFCDYAQKATVVAFTAPLLLEATPYILSTAAIVTIEELAGVPTPVGTLRNQAARQVVNRANSELIKKLEHAFAKGRLGYLGNKELAKQKAIDLVARNKPLLKNGDNTLIGLINGKETSIKAFVKNGTVQNMNIYPGISKRISLGPIIKFGKQTW